MVVVGSLRRLLVFLILLQTMAWYLVTYYQDRGGDGGIGQGGGGNGGIGMEPDDERGGVGNGGGGVDEVVVLNDFDEVVADEQQVDVTAEDDDATPTTRSQHRRSRSEARAAALEDIFVSQDNVGVVLASQNYNAIKKFLPTSSPTPRSRTCAVVGNAGVLKLGRHGSSIDRHDAVWRVNQAPVGGKEYQAIVGSKVTFRLLNSKWSTVYCEDGVYSDQVPGGTSNLARYLMGLEPPNATLVASRADAGAFDRLATAQHRRRPDLQPTALLSSRVISRARAWLLTYNNTAGDVSPSTGLLAVYVAMQLCERVSVYGFSLVDSRWAADMKDKGKRYHYFHKFHDSEQLRAHKHHAFSLEGDFLKSLDDEGKLRLCASRDRCGVVHETTK